MNKNYYWIILLAIITIGVMYASGMSNTYLSQPYDLGFNQYLDLKMGVMFLTLLAVGFAIGLMTIKKKKK